MFSFKTLLTIRQNSLYVTVCMIVRTSCQGYFIHSLSTLYYYNAPSLTTRLTGDYRDRTCIGKRDPALLDTPSSVGSIRSQYITSLQVNQPCRCYFIFFQLTCSVCFRVDIADFFQFQAAFQPDSIINATTYEKHIMRIGILRCKPLDTKQKLQMLYRYHKWH